ncbi:MAG: HAD-IA family hydrolase [Candidatus Cloacimonetes bacterium]|nr:HAD-IA family hydrolase [Candidatus Cloacimonadota bacterium]
MAIENVIFDLGKVLINFDFTAFYQKLGYNARERSLDEASEAIFDFEAGKTSKQEFLDELKIIYDFDLPLDEFKILWCEIFSEMTDMIQLARKISEKYPVYIFSNTDEIHFPYIWENYPSLHFFRDNLMLSYQLGAVKPHPEAYIKALQKYDLKPEKCLFIDDHPLNIKAALNLNMKGIIHDNYEDTFLKLTSLLNF